jgi:hypothetical protein
MVNHELVLKPGDTLTLTVAATDAADAGLAVVGGKRNRTRKAKQEGGKKAMSGYMKFCQKMRPEILKENPGIEFKDVGKRLGAKWRALSDSEKKGY